VLCRYGLNTRNKRLALIARHRDPYERKPLVAPPERHIEASVPGEKVQLDCFYVGRLQGTKGTVWRTPPPTSLPASPGPSCTPRRRTRARASHASSSTASRAS
jgi:hypothetical protein